MNYSSTFLQHMILFDIFLMMFKVHFLYEQINVCFWETAHLPLPQPNINPYFSRWPKCWLRWGVGGQLQYLAKG